MVLSCVEKVSVLSLFKFKERTETTQICVVLRNLKGKRKRELFREAYRQGEVDTGFHFIVFNNGLFETDREIKAVAGYNLPEGETSVYVLADTLGRKKISDAQQYVLNELKAHYNVPIKFITDEV